MGARLALAAGLLRQERRAAAGLEHSPWAPAQVVMAPMQRAKICASKPRISTWQCFGGNGPSSSIAAAASGLAAGTALVRLAFYAPLQISQILVSSLLTPQEASCWHPLGQPATVRESHLGQAAGFCFGWRALASQNKG